MKILRSMVLAALLLPASDALAADTLKIWFSLSVRY
mgnify:CR=1 FL=1